MIMLGMWVCAIPFGLILLMLMAMMSSKRNLQRELDELNKQVAVVKGKQQENDGNLMYAAVLALLLVLPFLTLAELILLGMR